MSKLTRRLQVIASLVNRRKVCDVGCDHGKLAEYLLRHNLVDSVIVSDISMPSLQKAIDLLSKNEYNYEYIHCDGLVGYSGKSVEQCIISGMGGDEIIKIISSAPIQINSFILSPQHNNIDVKKFILEKGYEINYDIIIKDKGKFYNIFRCMKNDKLQKLNEFDLYFGNENFTNPSSDIEEFVKLELIKVRNILKNTPNNEYFNNYLKLLTEYNKRK